MRTFNENDNSDSDSDSEEQSNGERDRVAILQEDVILSYEHIEDFE